MTFQRRSAAHEEVTDLDENERLLATLTHRSWSGFSVMETRSLLYGLVDAALEAEQRGFYMKDGVKVLLVTKDDYDALWKSVEHPMKELLHVARQSSGAIKGEHRKDLVEAIKAAAPQVQGLAIPQEAPKGTPERRRGL